MKGVESEKKINQPKNWFELFRKKMPYPIRLSVTVAVIITVAQYLIDLLIAYFLSSFAQEKLNILVTLTITSICTRPLVLLSQHWSMRKGTVLGVGYVLNYLFNSHKSDDKQFTSELLLKSANIPIYIIQPIIHFFSSIINLILTSFLILFLLSNLEIKLLPLIPVVISFYLIFLTLRKVNNNFAAKINVYQNHLGSLAPNFVVGRKELFQSTSSEILVSQYLQTEDEYRKAVNGQRFISQYPKHAIESIAMGCVVLLYFMDVSTASMSALGALGYVGVRAMPQFGNLIAAYSSLLGYFPSTASIFEEINEETTKIVRSSEQNSVLKVINLNISNCRFKDLSFIITQGEKLIVDMPSGYGKSTLLDTIVGFRSDKLIYSGIIEQKERPYYLQQNTFLYEGELGVNIFMTQDWRKDISEERLEYIEGLKHMLNIFWHNDMHVSRQTLSGGEVQRIALLRFLASNRRLGLLDEAFSAVDEKMSKKMIDIITSSDKTILMTLHNNSLKDYAIKLGYRIIS